MGPPFFLKDIQPDAGTTYQELSRYDSPRVHTERVHSFSLCAMKPPKTSDLIGIINQIAPPGLAEKWDNCGLQVGDPRQEVTRIMVSLEATEAVLDAAVTAGCNLLVTHHPLIFKPLSSITTATCQGRLIHKAIASGISIISMHTSFDAADGGLNDILAERIGLVDTRPLRRQPPEELTKLVVFVPASHLETVRDALLPWGEVLGAYRDCSFATPGEGTFTPQAGAEPFTGTVGTRECVAEQRLELLVNRNALARAIKALTAAHPYEEPAFDIYPLLNEGKAAGLGRIGTLAAPRPLADFAKQVSDQLAVPALRYTGDPAAKIRTVALCSGSGASLLRDAVRAGADVLVTGDVKFHDARDAQDMGICLVDAGHFQTEIIMAEAVADLLRERLSAAGWVDTPVEACRAESDPFCHVTH